MAIHISRSPEDSLAIGEGWGKAIPPGTVIGLSGELGAGKTQLVKGLALGLGYQGRVHSPTFTLLNYYPGGRFPLCHMDLYRLASVDEVRAAGLEEYFFREDLIVVVEWIDRIELAAQPRGTLFRSVRIEIQNDDSRKIIYEDFSA